MDLLPLVEPLDFPVSRSWVAGTPRSTPTGAPLDGVYRESYCAIRVASDDGTIGGAVRKLESALGRAESFRDLLETPTLKKMLYCTLNGEAEEVEPDTLRFLANWGIALGIDGGSAPSVS